MAIRFIVEVAWQAHFVTNMFIKPTAEELANFEPDFVVYNASKAKVENYKELGLNSETCKLPPSTSPARSRSSSTPGTAANEEGHVLHDELLPAAEGHGLHALLCQHR